MAGISEAVINCIDANDNFVVEAGAGSGKTYTLVEALRYIISTRSEEFAGRGQQIACITYTNVAANEIKTRIDNSPFVRVSTIHDFLWSIIRRYQRELRECLISENDRQTEDRRIDNIILDNTIIEYWQYGRKWTEGKVHHDDVINLSSLMFSKYPKLTKLVSDSFPIIFVDEYQDTQHKVIELLLDYLAMNNKYPIIGLFGDSMQKIYNTGVGELQRSDLTIIKKEENYRCSISVINVLNQLRPKLQQIPGGDNSSGSARFFHIPSDSSAAVTTMRSRLQAEGWEDSTSKVLMLTRRSIAKEQGWNDLMQVYHRRDRNYSVDDLMRRDDEFGETFEIIENLALAFNERRYGDIYNILPTATSSLKLDQHTDKISFFNKLTKLDNLRNEGDIGSVLDFVWNCQLVARTSRIIKLEESANSSVNDESKERLAEFLRDLRTIPYRQVVRLHQYLEKNTPFSTSHGTKGEEYDNVLVVIDDKLWNQYKFSAVLEGKTSANQYSRSLNLFYVCCSRARNNLVVLMLNSSKESISGARRIFGTDQVFEL